MKNPKDSLSLLNKVRQLEMNLPALFYSLSEAIVIVDENQYILFYNRNAEKLFGYSHEEIIGENLSTLFLDSRKYKGRVSLTNLAEYHSLISNTLKSVYSECRRKDSVNFIAESSISYLPLAHGKSFLLCVRDITERLNLEIELKKSKERLEKIISSAADALIMIDKDNKILCFNKSAEKTFGFDGGALIGNDLSLIIRNYRFEVFFNDLIGIEETVELKTERKELIGVRKDGIEFHVEASITEKIIYNEPVCILILRDISSRKLLERQLVSHLNDLESVDNQKEKYFSLIAHDLRSPFGNLLGYIDYMRQNVGQISNEELSEILRSSSVSAKNIFQLLESLLDWTRMQMNRINISPVLFDPQVKIKEALFLYKESIESKSITIKNNVTVTSNIYADINMFYTIIRNLISNAIKFSNKGGLIEINYRKEFGSFYIEVSDQGIGMDEETLSKLFITAQKNNSFGTKGEMGFGLGLLMVKDFVELCNGTITVRSKKQFGTKITISFPTINFQD